MATLYSWTIATTTARSAVVSALPAPTFAPTGSTGGGCNGVFHEQSYYLDLFDRIMPADYISTIEATPNGGYELFTAIATVGSRASRAVERFECGSYFIFAQGGACATCTVEFYRETIAAGAVTVKAGTIVSCSASGRRFRLTSDVFFSNASVGPETGVVQAVLYGWEYNVTGARTTARGETLPGEIDTIYTLIEDPAFGDPSIAVRQIVDAEGGRGQELDLLGADRGIARAASESDERYRLRCRSLPRVVTPRAIRESVLELYAPFGVEPQFIETWQQTYQEFYDAPQTTFPLHPEYNPNLFVYDDPRPSTPFRNRNIDSVEQFATFIVVVPSLSPCQDNGLAYDDPATSPSQLNSPYGRRSLGAYDIPADFDQTIASTGFYDGDDSGANAVVKGLYSLLQDIKLGGVTAIVELQGQ